MPSILPSFRVDVDQFARMFAFVADDGRPDLESRQSAKPAAAQNKSNRRDRPPHLPGYRGPGQALAAQSLDLVFSRRRQPGRARRSIRPVRPIAIPPFAHRLWIDRNGSRDRGNCPASFKAFDHQHSTTRRGSGILMNFHPGLHGEDCVFGNHNLSSKPRKDNLHSNDS
jgi:hypothetical protein